MFNKLPNDILFNIALNLDNIEDVINYSMVTKDLYDYFDDKQYSYWGSNLYIKKFGSAEKRTAIISKPVFNMKQELIRITDFTEFQKLSGRPIWTEHDFYLYWSSIEAVSNKYIKNIDLDAMISPLLNSNYLC